MTPLPRPDARPQGPFEAAMAALEAEEAFRAVLPPEMGGAGLGWAPGTAQATARLLREAGRRDLSASRLLEGHVNAAKLVEMHAEPADRDAFRETVAGGGLAGVWGADAGAPVTLARGRLTGVKRFASGLGRLAVALVTAKVEAGAVQLALVAADDPARADAGAWAMSGMRETASGTYALDGLAPLALVGPPGAYLREPWLQGGIWRYCAAHVGGAEALVQAWREALETRGRLDDDAQRARLAKALCACETAWLWVSRTADLVEEGQAATDDAVAHALLGREVVERRCCEVLALAERALGMAAFEEGSRVDRIRRDLGLYLRQAMPDAKLREGLRLALGSGRPIGAIW